MKEKVQKPKIAWPCRKLVEVDWEDSTSTGGWMDPDVHQRYGKERSCRSAGYVLARTKTEVVIAQSMSCGGKVNDTISIPAACVRRVRRLT